MDAEEFNLRREKYELVATENYEKLKNYQLEMVLECARSNYDPLELRGMLKLIAKTDAWEEEFIKIKKR